MKAAAGNFLTTQRTGNLLYVSGHVSAAGDDPIVGKVGAEQTQERAYEGARNVANQLLGALEADLGSLDRVAKIVKVNGYVNVAPDFTNIPAVIDGCSDRLVEVLGERGRHARAALGVASLPAGSSVEVEMIVEIA
jgi:enamine deaminase RidA (YjgF/YER057c/UK114 family)